MMRDLGSALVKGAASGNQSNVASSKTVQVKTFVTTVPPNRYGQSGRRKGR